LKNFPGEKSPDSCLQGCGGERKGERKGRGTERMGREREGLKGFLPSKGKGAGSTPLYRSNI